MWLKLNLYWSCHIRIEVRYRAHWADNARRIARVNGTEYINRKNNTIFSKRFEVVQRCCSKKCINKFTEDIQYCLFSDFYSRPKPSKQLQDIYLQSCIEKFESHVFLVNTRSGLRWNQWYYYVTVETVKIKLC